MKYRKGLSRPGRCLRLPTGSLNDTPYPPYLTARPNREADGLLADITSAA